MGCLVGWLASACFASWAAWLVGWFVGWLVGWLLWLVGQIFGGLARRLSGLSSRFVG